jgi:hypothetical protein
MALAMAVRAGFTAIASEVEVVQAGSVLEHRVVPLLTTRHDGLAVVVHVVAAELQDRGAVRRPGGHRSKAQFRPKSSAKLAVTSG